jgi:hypothetical protein
LHAGALQHRRNRGGVVLALLEARARDEEGLHRGRWPPAIDRGMLVAA